MSHIFVHNVYFRYSRYEKYNLEDINLHLYQDDFILLNGPNGAGKTTLISLILGFLKPLSGNIIWETENKLFSYLPQKAFFNSVSMKVIDVVASSFIKKNTLIFKGYKKEKEKSWSILEQLGLAELGNKEFSHLSGGQAQKILLARTLVNPAMFIFLDEPFSNMDKDSQDFMMDVLKKQRGQSGIIMISHDMDLISKHEGRFCYLNQGKLLCYNSVRDMEHSFFHHKKPYMTNPCECDDYE